MYKAVNLSQGEFEKIIKEAVETIPKKFLEKLDNVAIIVEDESNVYQRQKLRLRRRESSILGLYEGVPQTKREGYNTVLPDRITIFKKPVEAFARSKDDLKEIVKNIIWHEIAHHFGMDETEVCEAERKRKEKLAQTQTGIKA